jgi:hypothetical protein
MSAAQQQRTRTALLTTEAALLERMRRTVDAIVKAHFSTDPAKEAVFAGISATAAALQRHLPAVIAAGKASARNAALATLHADADALRRELRRAGEADTLPELPRPSDTVQVDRQESRKVAAGFAEAWRGAATTALLGSVDARDNVRLRALVAQTTAKTAHHVERIAATENAKAFNDERVRASSTFQLGTVVVTKLWDSTLDARTCPICESLDGQIVPVAADFTYGGRAVVPGRVHPFCRCTFHLIRGTA